MFNVDKYLSLFFFAGLMGLVVLNPDGSGRVIKALADANTALLRTVQGR